jgi:hypothetical protein
MRKQLSSFEKKARYTDIMELNHWLRRRMRMCYLKQWGRARKRIGELVRLGSPTHQAILTGLSRKASPASGYPASCQDVRHQLRTIKAVSAGSGACFFTHAVDWNPLSGYGPMISSNRHVRSEHAWWCGEERLITAPYPIGPSVCLVDHFSRHVCPQERHCGL